MVEYILGALLIAFILDTIDVDTVLIEGIYDLTGYQLTNSAYYVVFALIGVVSGLLRKG